MRPTPEGTAFLAKARALMAAHDEAARLDGEPAMRFAIGASDHALGTGLEEVVRCARAALPRRSTMELRLGTSQHVRASFDSGELDAAIIRREAGGSESEVLGNDPLGWRSVENGGVEEDVVPLVTLGPPCGIRATAIRQLDAVNRPWREACVAGSCTALLAAVGAGLASRPWVRCRRGTWPMPGIASGYLIFRRRRS